MHQALHKSLQVVRYWQKVCELEETPPSTSEVFEPVQNYVQSLVTWPAYLP